MITTNILIVSLATRLEIKAPNNKERNASRMAGKLSLLHNNNPVNIGIQRIPNVKYILT